MAVGAGRDRRQGGRNLDLLPLRDLLDLPYLVGLGYKRVDALNMVLLAAVVAVPMLFFGGLPIGSAARWCSFTGTAVMMGLHSAFFWLPR